MLKFFEKYAFFLILALSAYIFFSPVGEGALPFAYADKVLHLIVFAGLAITALRRFIEVKQVAAWLLVYAILIEVIQHFFISGRQFDVMDVTADALGFIIILIWKKQI